MVNSITNRSVLTTVLTVVILLTAPGLSLAQTQPSFTLRIEKDEGQTGFGALQGQVTSVDIDLIEADAPLGRFRIVVSYPTRFLQFEGLSLDRSVLMNQCGWDEITTEILPLEDTSGNCPRNFVVISGRAQFGPGNPGNNCIETGNMFSLRFLLLSGRYFQCQFVPVKFAFVDCRSNLLQLQTGGLVWAADSVENPWSGGYGDCSLPLVPTDPGQLFPTDSRYPQPCADSFGGTPDGSLRLIDGGVDVVCTGVSWEPGDLNLDGLNYTIADQVLYERYFLFGDTVFPKPTIVVPFAFEEVVFASDVNKDEVPLKIADLVRLVRVINGDRSTYWGPSRPQDPPTTIRCQVSKDGSLYADQPVGGAYVTFEGQADFTIFDDHLTWRSQYRPEDNLTHVVIYSEQSSSPISGAIISSNQPFNSVELSELDGGPTNTVRGSLLPDEFVLYQNYPNPFNPSTSIEFALPIRSDFKLIIFNAQGQQVETRQGSAEAGVNKVEWDGSNYASGVYLYKLEALGYEQTRKMLLLK